MRKRLSPRWLFSSILILGVVAGAPLLFADEPGDAAQTQESKKAKVHILKGRVLDKAGGEPVAGAEVALADAKAGQILWDRGTDLRPSAPASKMFGFITKRNGKRHGKATTDEDGWFEVSHLAYGTYNVAAVHADKGMALMEKFEYDKHRGALVIALSTDLQASQSSLSGKILDSNGRPVEGAEIGITPAVGGSMFWNVDGGLFVMGSGSQMVFESGEQRQFDRLFSPQGQGNKTSSDVDGAFSLFRVRPGTYNVVAIHRLKGMSVVEGVEIKAGMDPLTLQLKAEEEGERVTFSGHVVDANGEPVHRARVGIAEAEHGRINGSPDGDVMPHWYDPDGKYSGWFYYQDNEGRYGTGRTDKAGSFNIKDIRPGKYRLMAMHRKRGVRVLTEVEVAQNADEVKIELEAPLFIEGTLKGLRLKKGSILGNEYANISPVGLPEGIYFNAPISSAKDGAFKVGPLPRVANWSISAGKYIRKQGYWATLLQMPVKLDLEQIEPIEIDLTQRNKLSGIVKGPKGEPLSDVSVLAKVEGEIEMAIGAITNSKGEYTISGLADGAYMLEALRHAPRTAPG